MKKIIYSENIVKYYGSGDEKRYVLDNVCAEINEGEFVSVMGPSGSGKSTLLFALSGMDTTSGGTVSFDGRNLSSFNEQELADLRRSEMGFVFQQPTMLKNLNLLDNIILPSVSRSRKNTEVAVKKAKTLMARMGISDLETRDITQVSGGQLQRAGICRALMSEPKIIFGDEPTGALNSKSAEEIMEILLEINTEGTAVMLVTHDAKVAARSERILFMSDGKIVSEIKLPKYKGTGLDERMKQISGKMQEIGI